ncbi:MAG TPA: DUF5060 domain-containing protein [Verrucomicrobiae bacterium]|nr:DUF5060 domain-containing protein [Verrucomicrobiae bacterium]
MKTPFSTFGVRALAYSAILYLLSSIFVSLAAAADPPSPSGFGAASTVEQWGIYEVALHGPTNGNPFLDVRFSAAFSNGSKTVEVPGFYDGDGIYRVRFMPDAPGVWHYETRANRWPLTKHLGTFTVTPATGNDHGPVRVHDTYHFAYADGTPYYPFGTTCYNWLQAPDDWQELTLKTLAGSPFNKVRFLVFPQNVDFKKSASPALFPFAGTPPNDWDYTRFNPAFFQKMEQRVGQLRDLGIEADIILFNPYGKRWGFDTMDRAGDERYLRYIVARLAADRNVWWSMANEYDFLRTKTTADWDRYFQIVQKADPWHHLRSVHNGYFIYDNSQPWITHASIQMDSAVEDPSRALLYRDVWRKPVVFDEVGYEGDEPARWGHLSAQEMVFRIWNGFIAGTYVGHGECYLNTNDTWLSYGGVLRGQSPPRIAFLRKMVEAAPGYGLDPIDKDHDSGMGGTPGEYYLKYFGKATPAFWKFELPQEGLTNGMQFQVDVIDTWNMTITPVNGPFTMERKDRYTFEDRDGRPVELPGKPYMALRITYAGGAATPARTIAPIEP